jgi:large exoprotein involved in heme utilization and adhesion
MSNGGLRRFAAYPPYPIIRHLTNDNRPIIETDPAYTQNRAWASSDFLFDGLGLDILLKRLGDGYYEQRLVAEQIARLTGKSSQQYYDTAGNRLWYEAGQ